jgi:hypothetical protein
VPLLLPFGIEGPDRKPRSEHKAGGIGRYRERLRRFILVDLERLAIELGGEIVLPIRGGEPGDLRRGEAGGGCAVAQARACEVEQHWSGVA